MPMQLGGNNADLVVQGIERGLNNSAVSRLSGAHTSTVRKMRLLLEKSRGVEFLCECGKRADHREPCESRRPERNKRIDRGLSESGRKFFQMLAAAKGIAK